MKTLLRILICFMLFSALGISLKAQQNSSEEELYNTIESKLKSLSDTVYSVKYTFDIHQNINSEDLYIPVQDPYETLSSSIFFSAKNTLGFWVFGLFANDQILFYESITEYCEAVYFSGSIDLNKNNLVNIIASCSALTRDENNTWVATSSHYIVSWDGQEGKLISALDSEGNTIIRSNSSDYFEILDIDGDYIYELITREKKNGNLIDKHWQWDGDKYSSLTLGLEEGIFFSADDATGQIKALLDYKEETFQYSYKIISSSDSKKPIQEFLLSHIGTDTAGDSPDSWNFSGGGKSEYLIKWSTNSPNYYIKPGDSLDNFRIYSKNLPSIKTGYLRSQHSLPKTSNPQFSIQKYFQDQRENSFKKITLAPWLPDSSMSLQDFTDTLKTFHYRACEELDWATDAAVCVQLKEQVEKFLLVDPMPCSRQVA